MTREGNSFSQLNVVLAPAHYVVDFGEFGSESSWSGEFILRLSKMGVNLTIITEGCVPKEPTLSNVSFAYVGRRKSKWFPGFWGALIFHLKVFIKLRKILKNKKMDVVHHFLPFGYQTTFNFFSILRRSGHPRFVVGPLQLPLEFQGSSPKVVNFWRPGVTRSGEKWVSRLLFSLSRPILAFLQMKTLRHADLIVAVNHKAAELYRPMLGDGPDHLSVIPIGVDLEVFKPSLDGNSRRPFSLLTIGYLIERKGVDLILKALSSLKENKIDVQLNIVGEGPERLNLEKMVSELGLESQVVFHGYIPHQQIATFYRKSDIFCSMSLSESWGQVYLEAMASGLPLVVSKTNGSEGIVQDSVTGFLIEQGDVRGFATCVRKIIEIEGLRRAMSKNAREKVEKEYNWDLITQKYISLYEKILN